VLLVGIAEWSAQVGALVECTEVYLVELLLVGAFKWVTFEWVLE
jgi:hypothetical protein